MKRILEILARISAYLMDRRKCTWRGVLVEDFLIIVFLISPWQLLITAAYGSLYIGTSQQTAAEVYRDVVAMELTLMTMAGLVYLAVLSLRAKDWLTRLSCTSNVDQED